MNRSGNARQPGTLPTIFVGDHVSAGNSSKRINHYTVLRTVEDMFGLPHDGAGATAAPITGIWTHGRR